MSRENIGQTIKVALLLCIISSIVVSTTAVLLRSRQEANKKNEYRKNILIAAGLIDSSTHPTQDEIDRQFRKIHVKAIVLKTGQETDKVNLDTYIPFEAASSSNSGRELTQTEDQAGIKYLENISLVYFLKDQEGEISQYIFPIRGYGLWSTMHGFLSLDYDLQTIKGITFYEHKETPGLGGEIENASWQHSFAGKLAFDDHQQPIIEVVKGTVSEATPGHEHKVDGLSGATITSNGVTNLLKFWLGNTGFGPYIQRERKQHTHPQHITRNEM